MEGINFKNLDARAMCESFRFNICDQNYATPEGNETETTEEQLSTEKSCLAAFQLYMFQNKIDVPVLHREKHVNFLLKNLSNLSHDFASLEGSRTWIVFWCLNGLRILKHDIDHHLLSKTVKFLASCQKSSGGFGGSPSHVAHLATTYAAVMALVSIGTKDALSIIDRKALYDFLVAVKQPNGSFKMHADGEVDVRGVYCAAAVASVTRILDNKLFDMTPAWLVSCQTYEGGFGAEPFVEAHGGYTYCAVAALAILQKLSMLNTDLLLKWSADRQLAYEGGFQGRANKLVDVCYSFWMGAIFPIMEYELKIVDDKKYNFGCLFDPEGLQNYILFLCQEYHKGGIRDKPEKNPDAYHTCYGLAGLAIAQHYSLREGGKVVGGEANEVADINPLYNVVSSFHTTAANYFENLPKLE